MIDRFWRRFPSLSIGHPAGFGSALLALLLALAPVEARAAEANAVAAALAAISADKMQQCINVLADDAFEGREAGSRGGRAACAYLTEQLEKRHIAGAGVDGTLYQDFDPNSRNLLGRLEGSDPKLKDRYVIISAHYDHVGYGKRTNSFGPIGFIHKGADDNASGVAGLMAVIDAFNKLPEHPKRTVLFAFWDGEEQGLLGSKYWLAHPTVPLDHVAIMVNMDMIGRLRKEKVEVYGTRTENGLRRMLSEENGGGKLLLDFHWEMRADSDHYPFYEKNIPDLLIHTGLHSDYHRPSDTADKINSAGMQEVCQFAFRTAVDLAEADQLADFRPKAHEENAASLAALERPLPALPGRLGIRWNEDDEKSKNKEPGTAGRESVERSVPGSTAGASPHLGLQVAEVVSGSPADKAGMLAGDRIVRFDGHDYTNAADLRTQVMAADSPAAIVVERAGSEKPVELSVKLSGEPVRIGIAWQVDDAEPRSVVLVRVVPDSPADRAGLKLDDRVYQVGGKDFASTDEFMQLLSTAASPVELTVETKGQLRRVRLETTAKVAANPKHGNQPVTE